MEGMATLDLRENGKGERGSWKRTRGKHMDRGAELVMRSAHPTWCRLSCSLNAIFPQATCSQIQHRQGQGGWG